MSAGGGQRSTAVLGSSSSGSLFDILKSQQKGKLAEENRAKIDALEESPLRQLLEEISSKFGVRDNSDEEKTLWKNAFLAALSGDSSDLLNKLTMYLIDNNRSLDTLHDCGDIDRLISSGALDDIILQMCPELGNLKDPRFSLAEALKRDSRFREELKKLNPEAYQRVKVFNDELHGVVSAKFEELKRNITQDGIRNSIAQILDGYKPESRSTPPTPASKASIDYQTKRNKGLLEYYEKILQRYGVNPPLKDVMGSFVPRLLNNGAVDAMRSFRRPLDKLKDAVQQGGDDALLVGLFPPHVTKLLGKDNERVAPSKMEEGAGGFLQAVFGLGETVSLTEEEALEYLMEKLGITKETALNIIVDMGLGPINFGRLLITVASILDSANTVFGPLGSLPPKFYAAGEPFAHPKYKKRYVLSDTLFTSLLCEKLGIRFEMAYVSAVFSETTQQVGVHLRFTAPGKEPIDIIYDMEPGETSGQSLSGLMTMILSFGALDPDGEGRFYSVKAETATKFAEGSSIRQFFDKDLVSLQELFKQSALGREGKSTVMNLLVREKDGRSIGLLDAFEDGGRIAAGLGVPRNFLHEIAVALAKDIKGVQDPSQFRIITSLIDENALNPCNYCFVTGDLQCYNTAKVADITALFYTRVGGEYVVSEIYISSKCRPGDIDQREISRIIGTLNASSASIGGNSSTSVSASVGSFTGFSLGAEERPSAGLSAAAASSSSSSARRKSKGNSAAAASSSSSSAGGNASTGSEDDELPSSSASGNSSVSSSTGDIARPTLSSLLTEEESSIATGNTETGFKLLGAYAAKKSQKKGGKVSLSAASAADEQIEGGNSASSTLSPQSKGARKSSQSRISSEVGGGAASSLSLGRRTREQSNNQKVASVIMSTLKTAEGVPELLSPLEEAVDNIGVSTRSVQRGTRIGGHRKTKKKHIGEKQRITQKGGWRERLPVTIGARGKAALPVSGFEIGGGGFGGFGAGKEGGGGFGTGGGGGFGTGGGGGFGTGGGGGFGTGGGGGFGTGGGGGFGEDESSNDANIEQYELELLETSDGEDEIHDRQFILKILMDIIRSIVGYRVVECFSQPFIIIRELLIAIQTDDFTYFIYLVDEVSKLLGVGETFSSQLIASSEFPDTEEFSNSIASFFYELLKLSANAADIIFSATEIIEAKFIEVSQEIIERIKYSPNIYELLDNSGKPDITKAMELAFSPFKYSDEYTRILHYFAFPLYFMFSAIGTRAIKVPVLASIEGCEFGTDDARDIAEGGVFTIQSSGVNSSILAAAPSTFAGSSPSSLAASFSPPTSTPSSNQLLALGAQQSGTAFSSSGGGVALSSHSWGGSESPITLPSVPYSLSTRIQSSLSGGESSRVLRTPEKSTGPRFSSGPTVVRRLPSTLRQTPEYGTIYSKKSTAIISDLFIRALQTEVYNYLQKTNQSLSEEQKEVFNPEYRDREYATNVKSALEDIHKKFPFLTPAKINAVASRTGIKIGGARRKTRRSRDKIRHHATRRGRKRKD